MKKLYKHILLFPLVFTFCACGKMDYHSRSDFAERAKGSILLQQPAFTNGEIITPEQQARIADRTMGGLSFTPGASNGKPGDPLYFVLRRHKGIVSAETVLYESKNKDKTFFDNSMFKFGIDRRNEGANFDITLRW